MKLPKNAKPVPSLPGYFVNRNGMVWGPNGLLKPFGNKAGYLMVSALGGQHFVHTIVLEAFSGPRPSAVHQCRHLNGMHTDNRARNLKWGTPAQQGADRRRHGTTPVGERHPMRVLNAGQVQQIRSLFGHLPTVEIAHRFGVAPNTVWNVARGVTWKHLPSAQPLGEK